MELGHFSRALESWTPESGTKKGSERRCRSLEHKFQVIPIKLFKIVEFISVEEEDYSSEVHVYKLEIDISTFVRSQNIVIYTLIYLFCP